VKCHTTNSDSGVRFIGTAKHLIKQGSRWVDHLGSRLVRDRPVRSAWELHRLTTERSLSKRRRPNQQSTNAGLLSVRFSTRSTRIQAACPPGNTSKLNILREIWALGPGATLCEQRHVGMLKGPNGTPRSQIRRRFNFWAGDRPAGNKRLATSLTGPSRIT
jgi:hypothetical protein